jgi:hypothetical protein
MKCAIVSASVVLAIVAGVSASTASSAGLLKSVRAVSTAQTCSLSGLWLGQDRDKDAVGMWLEFAPDGSVVRAQGRIVNGDYALKGDSLVFSFRVRVPAGNAGSVPGDLSQRVSFKLAGTEMTRLAEQAKVKATIDEPGGGRGTAGGRGGTADTKPAVAALPVAVAPIAELTETKLTRVTDGDGGDRLSGVWTWTSKGGRTVTERFAGKRFAVLEAIGSQKGTYKLEDNKLSVTADGTTTAVNVGCAGSMLSLEAPNGPMRFVKFQYGGLTLERK